MTPGTAALSAFILGTVCGGIAVNVVSDSISRIRDGLADSVTIDAIPGPVDAGKKFAVSGTAKMREGHTLWIIAYGATGFTISSPDDISVDSSTRRWNFSSIVLGRQPDATGKSPDSGEPYTVSAAIVDEDGAETLRDVIGANPVNPAMSRSAPPGLIVEAKYSITPR